MYVETAMRLLVMFITAVCVLFLISSAVLDFLYRDRGAYSRAALIDIFVPNAALVRGRRLIEGGAYSSKYGKLIYFKSIEIFIKSYERNKNNLKTGSSRVLGSQLCFRPNTKYHPDVTAAILVSQDKETAAILVYQTHVIILHKYQLKKFSNAHYKIWKKKTL